MLGFFSPHKVFDKNFSGTPKQGTDSTSLLVFMSAIGVVLNVDRQSRKNMIK